MSFVPATSNRDLWMTLGALAAFLLGLGWWQRRDRLRGEAAAAADRALLEGEVIEDLGVQDEGWQH